MSQRTRGNNSTLPGSLSGAGKVSQRGSTRAAAEPSVPPRTRRRGERHQKALAGAAESRQARQPDVPSRVALHGDSTGNAPADTHSVSLLPQNLDAHDLARALRAVAGELERDPALAARVAAALRVEDLAAGKDDAAGLNVLVEQPVVDVVGTTRPIAGGVVSSRPTLDAVGGGNTGQGAAVAREPDLARRAAEDRDRYAAASEDAAAGKSVAHGGESVEDTGTPSRSDAETDTPGTHTPVGRSFRPRIVTGTAPELGRGVPDPVELRNRLGADGLRAALADLRVGTLRAMIRAYGLDSSGRLAGVNDAAKLRAAILAAVR